MLKKLFAILIIALIVYAGFVFGTPIYHYYAFKSDVKEFARIGRSIPPQELMEKIMEKARDYNIPITEDDVVITRDHDNQVNIQVGWQERVNLLNIYERRFDFSIDTSKE
ncbi:MAG: hypothetical protein Fur0020_14870 [Thermodesulfovibrionia bacterium]